MLIINSFNKGKRNINLLLIKFDFLLCVPIPIGKHSNEKMATHENVGFHLPQKSPNKKEAEV